MTAIAVAVNHAELGRELPAARPVEAFDTVTGKAQGLRRLKAAGCRVPNFFVISPQCFSAALAAGGARVQSLLRAPLRPTEHDCQHRAAAVARVLEESDVAGPLRAAVARSVAGARAGERHYAVRSSAADEDSERASFAGQLETQLNVPADGLVDAVLQVWRSAFSARALAYRAQRALDSDAGWPAVIVQEMVQVQASGVLFTRAPDSPEELLVCAGYGLGEGVVNDLVDVDTYRIDRRSGSIARQIRSKSTRIDPAPLGGTHRVEVAAAARTLPALSARALRNLHALGVRLENEFSQPLDIEFAIDRLGRIHLLQARPITSRVTASESPRLWDNSNVVESYPGLTLPLTFSFAQAGYAAAFAPYMKRRAIDYFPFRSPLRNRSDLFQSLIGLIHGRVYYNILAWYEMMSVLPGFARVRASWDRMIGISATAQTREHSLPWLPRQLAWAYCVSKLLAFQGTARRFARRFAPVYARFSSVDYGNLSATALIAQYEALRRAIGDDWRLTLDNDFAAMAHFEALHGLCRKWSERSESVANDLLRHAPGMESVRPVRALEALVARVRGDASLGALFARLDDEQILAKLRCDATYQDLGRAIDEYLRRYGDRCVEELKLEQPTFRQQPSMLVRTIRTLLTSSSCVTESGHAATHEAALQTVGTPVKRAILSWVARRARRALANRENMRFARARIFGIARQLFGALGQRLAEQELLGRADDIHYLTVEEVCAAVRGTGVTAELPRLVALRRAEYASFATARPPSRFWSNGAPRWRPEETSADNAGDGNDMYGTPCAGGRAEGTARIVANPAEAPPQGPHILVAESTDPGWVFLMTRARGIVVERGSVLSHTAIIGRELGIPTIVGVAAATRRIPNGACLSIDGATGSVRWQ
jgi:rifampicin phosphotransferase